MKPNIIKPDKNHEIIERIKQIKKDHPFWGYRRVWAYLNHRDHILINKKKTLRLLKEANLLVDRHIHKVKRTPSQRSKPQASKPLEIWGIDMTKFKLGSWGWLYLVVVLDWYTKKIVGWDLSLRSKADDWLKALDMAVMSEFPNGVRDQGLKLVSDNGCQPTSISFMKNMALLDIEQIFTSYNNPKGNADTERLIRTIKEEIIWINDFSTYEEAKAIIGNWINKEYNELYVHSKLGYLSPIEFEKQYYNQLLSVA